MYFSFTNIFFAKNKTYDIEFKNKFGKSSHIVKPFLKKNKIKP